MALIYGDIRTIERFSRHLNISKSTLYKQIQERKIRGQKISRSWCSQKNAIDHWPEKSHSHRREAEVDR